MRLLLDGDEANNNGNWQWISSVGVDPAPVTAASTTRCSSSSATTPRASTSAAGSRSSSDVPLEQLATPWEAGPRGPDRRPRRRAPRARSTPTPRPRARKLRARSARFTIEPKRPVHARLRGALHRRAGRPGRPSVGDDEVRLHFLVDDWSGPGHASCCARTARPSHGTVEADNEARAIEQAARIVSLDHDGTGYPEVGERDPIAGAAAARERLPAPGALPLALRGRRLVGHLRPHRARPGGQAPGRARRDLPAAAGAAAAARAPRSACEQDRRACTASPRRRWRASSTASRCWPWTPTRPTRNCRSCRGSARSMQG